MSAELFDQVLCLTIVVCVTLVIIVQILKGKS